MLKLITMKDLEKQAEIAKEIAREYFGNVIHNIDEILNEIKFERTLKSSNFNHETKTVFINSMYAEDVNHFVHELFHAISTNYYNDGVQIGFNNKIFKNFSENYLLETSFGYALNEGATHSFTRDATKNRFGEINPISSYNFCANIFKNIENYVGKDLMKLLYTNFGVKEFVKKVAQKCHTTEDNVLKLVLSMDAYLDTYRVYSVFFLKNDSEDATSLLANCYKYLFRIISDKKKYDGLEFEALNDISLEHLSKEEMKQYFTSIDRIDSKNLTSKEANINIEQIEDFAMDLYKKDFNKELKTLKDIPSELKCAEFYNFLLLNNYICSKNRIRRDFLKGDFNTALTKLIFDEKCEAFNMDNKLSDNIRTVLSTKFVIRAGCNISDYYMLKCINNKEFASYLKNNDEDYYNFLKEETSKSID